MNRKEFPLYSGLIKYFPLALLEVSNVSFVGDKQHNSGKEIFWDKSKSTDEPDALLRHLLDHANGEIYDKDGTRHLAKCAWRALSFLQRELENGK